MSITKVEYEHIILNEKGIPTIDGTTMKVSELIAEKIAYGWSAEEIHFQHPYLSLGQIYSALAYYWDHQKELEQEIESRLKSVKKIQATLNYLPLRDRLKSKGLI